LSLMSDCGGEKCSLELIGAQMCNPGLRQNVMSTACGWVRVRHTSVDRKKREIRS